MNVYPVDHAFVFAELQLRSAIFIAVLSVEHQVAKLNDAANITKMSNKLSTQCTDSK